MTSTIIRLYRWLHLSLTSCYFYSSPLSRSAPVAWGHWHDQHPNYQLDAISDYWKYSNFKMLYESIAEVPDINKEKLSVISKNQTGSRICETHRGTWCRNCYQNCLLYSNIFVKKQIDLYFSKIVMKGTRMKKLFLKIL